MQGNSTLEKFFSKANRSKAKVKPQRRRHVVRTPSRNHPSIQKIIRENRCPDNLDYGLLLSVDYSGDKKAAYLTLYVPKTRSVEFWVDNTSHQPYLLTDISPEEIEAIPEVRDHHGFTGAERIKLYNLLFFQEQLLTKVKAADPLSIGGVSTPKPLRRVLRERGIKVWEANIEYRQSYIMDRQLVPGLAYRIIDKHLEPVDPELDPDLVDKTLAVFSSERKETREVAKRYLPLLFALIPDIERVAVDIEVEVEQLDVIPDSNRAEQRIIAVSFASSSGKRKVMVLRRGDRATGEKSKLKNADIVFFDSETDLIEAAFIELWNAPIVLTFNGDNFDIPYLVNRAVLHLGFPREEAPFILARNETRHKRGVHIDLYKFLHNAAIRLYAFGGAYTETNLEAVSQALLGKGKIPLDIPIQELDLVDLASYCLNDAEITLNLTTFHHDLIMDLIILLMRISKAPMGTVTRNRISSWIRSLFYDEHRRRGYLIPTAEEIREEKGGSSTASIIKGHKFAGAIVIEPAPGIHFDVSVLDFSSLYPSIIKEYNLSYETVRCPHYECREKNRIPKTDHWFCSRRVGLCSEIIGLLRDFRVKWFKPLSKDKDIPEELARWYSVVQRALKVYVNASYGVFGSEAFALYCPPMAESTTALGRFAILQTVEKAKTLGLNVLYGDTDSVFIKKPEPEKLDLLMEWSKKSLGIDLELEKTYRWVALSERKKNYLGVFSDGRVDIKGLMGKKRNTPPFLQ
ncbi:MAG: DNA-directed DNA polymerase I, partial [Candidatus Ranarchaeia archaeon]